MSVNGYYQFTWGKMSEKIPIDGRAGSTAKDDFDSSLSEEPREMTFIESKVKDCLEKSRSGLRPANLSSESANQVGESLNITEEISSDY